MPEFGALIKIRPSFIFCFAVTKRSLHCSQHVVKWKPLTSINKLQMQKTSGKNDSQKKGTANTSVFHVLQPNDKITFRLTRLNISIKNSPIL